MFYIGLSHCFAVTGLWFAAIDRRVCLVFGLIVLAHGVWRVLHYWRHHPRLLEWGEAGWQLDGQLASLYGNYSYYPWFIQLHLQYRLTGRKVYLHLLVDSVPSQQAEQLSRLRFWLLNHEGVDQV